MVPQHYGQHLVGPFWSGHYELIRASFRAKCSPAVRTWRDSEDPWEAGTTPGSGWIKASDRGTEKKTMADRASDQSSLVVVAFVGFLSLE